MRIFGLLALLALPLASLAARKPSASTFDTYLARQSSSAPFEIDEQAYNDLTSTPRDYSVAILLTARHAKYACQICRDFDAEWSVIGRSWQKADRKGAKRVLLTTVDFDQGRNVFMKVHLRIRLEYPPVLTGLAPTPNCSRAAPLSPNHWAQCLPVLTAIPNGIHRPSDG